MSKNIRYGRVLIAGVISEAGVIAVLWVAIAAYWAASPEMSSAEFEGLGARIGYYVAPATGVVTTFLAVLWAARPLTTAFVAHGVLIGVASVLLTVGFLFGARPEDRLMYIIAFALRLVAGYAGGAVAQRMAGDRTARSRTAGVASRGGVR